MIEVLGILAATVLALVIIPFLQWNLRRKIIAISGTLSAALVLLAIVVYRDAADLNVHFQSRENLMLLEENGVVYTAIVAQQGEIPFHLDQDRLTADQILLARKQYDKIKGEYYRLFIFSPFAFPQSANLIKFGDVNLSVEQALDIIRSSTTLDDYAAIVLQHKHAVENETALFEAIKDRFSDPAELRGELFAKVMQHTTREEGNRFIPLSYKAKHLTVYEQTPYFLFVRILPESVLTMLWGEA